MNKKTALLSSLILLGVASPIGTVIASEPCFGVALAGQNDCETNTNACAGLAAFDGQADAYITLPNGLCEKLTGGSLEEGL